MTVDVLDESKIRKAFLKHLVTEAGWPSSAATTADVTNQSFLYKVDKPRTLPTAHPVHFGLIKNAGSVKHAATKGTEDLVGPILGGKLPTILVGTSLNIPRFDPLVFELFRNVNDGIYAVFVHDVIFAIHGAIGRTLKPSSKTPAWEPKNITNTTFVTFLKHLKDRISIPFPNYPSPVINPTVERRLLYADMVQTMAEIVLRDVVKFGITNRHF